MDDSTSLPATTTRSIAITTQPTTGTPSAVGADTTPIMDSSTWDLPDHAMHPAAPTDDDFQHFLNMSAMNNPMDDAPDFGFHDFHSASAGAGAGSGSGHLLQQPPRDQLDTPMSGTDAPMILSRAHTSLHQQISAITSAAPYQTIPTSLLPAPSPSEAMVNSIDAQIHFLQQQKLQAQQRQLEEQMEEHQAAFFARQSRMVPPTPQSLEMPARVNQYYGQPSPAGRQQPQMDFRYQPAKDQQQEVCPHTWLPNYADPEADVYPPRLSSRHAPRDALLH